jgi:hypothetical protein
MDVVNPADLPVADSDDKIARLDPTPARRTERIERNYLDRRIMREPVVPGKTARDRA